MSSHVFAFSINRAHLDTTTRLGSQPEIIPVVISARLVQGTEVAKPGAGPGLAGPLESTLVLATTGFHWTAANRPASIGNFFVVHPLSLTSKIVPFLLHQLACLAARSFEDA